MFPNTHPAIIDRETFTLVQDLRQHRHRPTRTGIVSMFSGLLYCADCGSKLGYSSTNNYKCEQAYFFCSGKTVVSKTEKVDGKRRQTVDIYYKTVGLWVAPEPETLEKEYMAHYQAIQKRKKKTA